jgi:DNA-directed RNA polymerase subunit RPC12/RpoP
VLRFLTLQAVFCLLSSAFYFLEVKTMTNGPWDRGTRAPNRGKGQFKEFEATELYCAKCRKAVPVRKRLLLVLPEGDKYEYRCALCGNTVGDKMDKTGEYFGVLRR